MRIPNIAIAAAVLLAGILGVYVGMRAFVNAPPPTPTVAATVTPSPTPEGPRSKGYVVAEGKPPLLVESTFPYVQGTLLTRIASRIDGLRAMVTPDGYMNPYATATVRLERLTNDEPNVISLWFVVENDDWGVPKEQARLFLQQLVWTATEEPGIELIRIWQNGGLSGGAAVAGEPANYEMTRKDFP